MTLTLRIENFASLDDGGPLWLSLDRRAASIGRGRSMDWVLPDPAKHISSHHFNVTYSDGTYWITDVSTNGTFLQGQRHRLEGPYGLRDGDRLLVGHYIIAVQIVAQPMPADPFGGQAAAGWSAPPPMPEESDPWEFGAAAPPPVAPPRPPSTPTGAGFDTMGSDFMPLQQPGQYGGGGPGSRGHGASIQSPGWPQSDPAQAMPHPSAIQQPGLPQHSPPVTMPPFGAQSPIAPPPALQMPGFAAPPAPPDAAQAAPAPVAPAPPVPQAVNPAAQPGHMPQMPPLAPGQDPFVAAFCAGAGLPPQAASQIPPEALAHMLGQVVRVSAEEIMRMLQDRANVKHFTKGGERTMRSATGNNPMKFLPDPEQAIEAMFLRPRDGFMTGPDGFKHALKDLSAHQQAVFAALQPALASVLDGLSPSQIEAAETTGNLLGGSRKGKAWDQFVKRWDEKENAGDHGMLDAFLTAFARAYAQANARSD